MNLYKVISIFFLVLTPLNGKLVPAIETEGRQFLIVDADTDTILFEYDADKKVPPSSMTKILTAYLMFEELKAGNISLDTTFKISQKASKAEGTRMYLSQGKTVKVKDLIQGIFVASANDACICVAENIEGSEEKFVHRMNQKLQSFGCVNSHFMNASGLPDPKHYSTCKDLYHISKKLYTDFPEYRHLFSQITFQFEKGLYKNLMTQFLKKFNGSDGLKTGHTQAGGYGVIASAMINQQRIFVIMNGCKTMVERNRNMDYLMGWAYQNFHQVRLFSKDNIIGYLPTWMGKYDRIPASLNKDVTMTLPKNMPLNNIVAELNCNGPLKAPIKEGESVGKLVIQVPNQNVYTEYLVYAKSSIESASILKRMLTTITYLIKKIL